MGVAFIGRGLGMVAAVVPGGVVTPSVFAETYRLLVATGYYLMTESGQAIRTQ
jgi:hypothetical protein